MTHVKIPYTPIPKKDFVINPITRNERLSEEKKMRQPYSLLIDAYSHIVPPKYREDLYAVDFQTAEKLLNQNKYDLAILDIMGVKGYDLLEIANKNAVPALMLTAHALSPDDFGKSISEGAKAYIPKEKMTEIAVFVTDLLKAQQGDEKPYKWFSPLKSFFEWKFGKEWLKTYREVRQEAERRYGSFPND